MALYKLTYKPSADKSLAKLDASMQRRIVAKINLLAADPWTAGAEKLARYKNLYRVRVGDYRVIFEMDKRTRTVDIVAVLPRAKAYQ